MRLRTALIVVAVMVVVAGALVGCGKRVPRTPAASPAAGSATATAPAGPATSAPAAKTPGTAGGTAAAPANSAPPASASGPAEAQAMPAGPVGKPKLTDAQYIKLIGEIGAAAAKYKNPKPEVDKIIAKYGLKPGKDLERENQAHLAGKTPAERKAFLHKLTDALLKSAPPEQAGTKAKTSK